jgi:hypothetical protein
VVTTATVARKRYLSLRIACTTGPLASLCNLSRRLPSLQAYVGSDRSIFTAPHPPPSQIVPLRTACAVHLLLDFRCIYPSSSPICGRSWTLFSALLKPLRNSLPLYCSSPTYLYQHWLPRPNPQNAHGAALRLVISPALKISSTYQREIILPLAPPQVFRRELLLNRSPPLLAPRHIPLQCLSLEVPLRTPKEDGLRER